MERIFEAFRTRHTPIDAYHPLRTPEQLAHGGELQATQKSATQIVCEKIRKAVREEFHDSYDAGSAARKPSSVDCRFPRGASAACLFPRGASDPDVPAWVPADLRQVEEIRRHTAKLLVAFKQASESQVNSLDCETLHAEASVLKRRLIAIHNDFRNARRAYLNYFGFEEPNKPAWIFDYSWSDAIIGALILLNCLLRKTSPHARPSMGSQVMHWMKARLPDRASTPRG